MARAGHWRVRVTVTGRDAYERAKRRTSGQCRAREGAGCRDYEVLSGVVCEEGSEGECLKRISDGEEAFALDCKKYAIQVLREYRFHPTRKWRFDFWIPAHQLGVEIEGGTWMAGRHNRGSGYAKDLEKYNAATLLGYRVLRFTTQMVTSGEAIELTLAALKGKG
jgi:very-short-patch-repair endonuclease